MSSPVDDAYPASRAPGTAAAKMGRYIGLDGRFEKGLVRLERYGDLAGPYEDLSRPGSLGTTALV